MNRQQERRLLWCVRAVLGAYLAGLLGMLVYLGTAWLAPAHAQVPHVAARYKLTLLREAHSQWGLDAPVAAFAAQIHQESAWNPEALSRVGAQGLAQFMPATATWWCERGRVSLVDCSPRNPAWALRAMVGYDRWLYERTPQRYTPHERLWVALRAYNGGLGHWQAEAAAAGFAQPTLSQVDAACGKARRAVVHCRENLGYPRRILVDLQPRYAGWGAVWEPTR